MSSPRWHLILNGKCAGDEALREAVAAMRGRGIDLHVRVTWEPGDAVRYVGEAIGAQVDCIVSAGGDGTLHEVAGAMAAAEGDAETLPALGLVPMGTANDFAVAAGIEDDPAQALVLVATTPAVPFDLLRLETGEGRVHWCANLASAGFGTAITADTGEGMKKMLGGLAYLITGLAKAGRIESLQARVNGPGFEWEGEFIALGVGNGRQAGGGQALCPQALIDDGLLDLTVVPPLDGEVAATLGTVIAAGKQEALERVAIRERLPWIELQSPAPFTLNLDGEPLQASRLRIECRRARLRMHLPADCSLLSASA